MSTTQTNSLPRTLPNVNVPPPQPAGPIAPPVNTNNAPPKASAPLPTTQPASHSVPPPSSAPAQPK